MRFAKGFARFWWDFVVGDDWRIAAGVVVVLAAGALLVAGTERARRARGRARGVWASCSWPSAASPRRRCGRGGA